MYASARALSGEAVTSAKLGGDHESQKTQLELDVGEAQRSAPPDSPASCPPPLFESSTAHASPSPACHPSSRLCPSSAHLPLSHFSRFPLFSSRKFSSSFISATRLLPPPSPGLCRKCLRTSERSYMLCPLVLAPLCLFPSCGLFLAAALSV